MIIVQPQGLCNISTFDHEMKEEFTLRVIVRALQAVVRALIVCDIDLILYGHTNYIIHHEQF